MSHYLQCLEEVMDVVMYVALLNRKKLFLLGKATYITTSITSSKHCKYWDKRPLEGDVRGPWPTYITPRSRQSAYSGVLVASKALLARQIFDRVCQSDLAAER